MIKKFNKVMLIYGGISSEREISIISAKEISKSLKRSEYDIIEIDANESLKKEIEVHSPDVIFNALHGTWGEDGKVQKIIESTGVPYTNSGINASEIAMDKYESAKKFMKNNIAYPITKLLSFEELDKNISLKYPYVLKPRSEGSSVGVAIISNYDDKKKYIMDNLNRKEVLMQEFIDGLEVQVAVIGDNKTGSIEIIPKNKFYDYESKYFDDGKTKHIIPPRISDDKILYVEELGMRAHKILGCKGISRSDFILDKKTNTFFILELNTQPGMTPTSLVPEIAHSKGINFDKLVNWIINDASTNR